MKKLLIILIPLFTLLSINAICVPVLSSLPSATATIFLDFDGQYVQCSSWNGGVPLNCAPSGLTDAQIVEIFYRVSEDFRPFNIDITTDSTVFLAAPLTQRMRIIITPTSGWYTGVGGVSYTGSFTWGDDIPGFVFPDRLGPYNTKMVAECCTHESGHTVGLSHQATYNESCSLVTVYNIGTGTGQTGWAPIMGNSYYENFSGWYNGPTPSGCTANQDALSIITSINGFTYRADDHSDDPAVNPTPINIVNSIFADSGIISTNTDKDVFKFNLNQAGYLHVDVNPFSVGPGNAGADLDVKLQLLDSSFQVMQVYDPQDILNASIDTSLGSGVYYLVVQGAGNAYTTNYGSLGSYNISGSFSSLYSTLPIKSVVLSGQADNGKHILNWNIISDEPLSSLSIEASGNGVDFTTLSQVPNSSISYSYNPTANNIIFYRLKVVSITDQAMYSNVVALNTNGADKAFKVSTMVYSEITVNASGNYYYQLADMSGRIMQTGSGHAGTNTININNSPNGIYLINIKSDTQRLTERIVKL